MSNLDYNSKSNIANTALADSGTNTTKLNVSLGLKDVSNALPGNEALDILADAVLLLVQLQVMMKLEPQVAVLLFLVALLVLEAVAEEVDAAAVELVLLETQDHQVKMVLLVKMEMLVEMVNMVLMVLLLMHPEVDAFLNAPLDLLDHQAQLDPKDLMETLVLMATMVVHLNLDLQAHLDQPAHLDNPAVPATQDNLVHLAKLKKVTHHPDLLDQPVLLVQLANPVQMANLEKVNLDLQDQLVTKDLMDLPVVLVRTAKPEMMVVMAMVADVTTAHLLVLLLDIKILD